MTEDLDQGKDRGIANNRPTYRVGCDIGGTFTDFVLFNEATGELIAEKCLTTPSDPSQGVLHGLERMKLQAGDFFAAIRQVAHASTLVANAVIQRKGAKCALLCTKGFRDMIELRRHVRVTTYELWSDPPKPLIPRYLRLPVEERTHADGSIETPVRGDDIKEIARVLQSEKVESIAIAFLHSYVNPENENDAKRMLGALLPGVPITTSASILPQIKEYERTSTTVVNAYVRPMVERYLSSLATRLNAVGIDASFHVMLSNGGLASVQTACQFPIRLIESGPVAGAKVVQHFSRSWGLKDVVSFDMGGTTAKACLVRDGEIPITDELEIARSHRFTKSSGFPIAVPGAHLIEIGAGGGSIADVNSMGLIQVGPESASSEPGPAAYGRGGSRATVTDADLVLGYLDPTFFAGGTMPLHADQAREAIDKSVSEKVNRDVLAAAWSIHDVVNETMASAIRMHIAERGGVLDGVTLVAFGGAGPVHAYNLGRKLGIRELVVPQRAGVLSAVGLIIAPPAYDVVKTYRVDLTDLNSDHIEAAYRELERDIERMLREVSPGGSVAFSRAVDVGYIGQGYQVTLPITERNDTIEADALWANFAEIYRAKYGYFYDDIPAEIANIRVRGQITGTHAEVKGREASGDPGADCRKASRDAYSAVAGAMVDFAVYDREKVQPGMSFAGPAIIEESSSTTVVDRGGQVEVDDEGSLMITIVRSSS